MNITLRELETYEEMLPHLSLINQLNPGLNKEDYARMLREMLKQGYRMVAVFDEERCVGLSGFWIGTKLYCDKYLEPDNVVIDKEYRSKGIGKLLLDWLEIEARKNSCRMLMLDAYSENFAGHKFYFREGFILRGFHFLKKL